MKRNDVVELINESYCEYAFGDSDEIRESENFGDFILTRLEKAGMLPPETHIQYNPDKPCMCGHGEWCEGCSSKGIFDNRWEPEE